MEKYLTKIKVTLPVIILGIFSQIYGQWEKYVIDSTLILPEVVAVGDLNGDTKPDVVVNDLHDDKFLWYENNYPIWFKHTLDSDIDGAYVMEIGDIDGDGDLDVAASGYEEKSIVWYENNYPDWNKHIIAKNLTVGGGIRISDIDGDDTLDIVSAGYLVGGDLVWYENNHPNWPRHLIRSNYKMVDGRVDDIDGDKLDDIAVCIPQENKVVWFKNENAGLSWSGFPIDDNLNGARHVYIGDLDGDGTKDIAASGQKGDIIVWYENNHPVWPKYIIDKNLDGARVKYIIDIDCDEKPDVLATGKNAGVVVWYKNNHPLWPKHVIDSNLKNANSLVSADINDDSIPDVIAVGTAPGNVVWYKNPYFMAHAIDDVDCDIDSSYVDPNNASLTVNAQLVIPENHSVTVFARIQGEAHALLYSIQLFDDGLHDDGDANDHLWSTGKCLKKFNEDMFSVDLSINDITTGTNYVHPKVSRFTTIGPVKIKEIELLQDTTANPGDMISAYVNLKNSSSLTTVHNISAKLACLDTLAEVSTKIYVGYGDIPATETVRPQSLYKITVNEGPFPANPHDLEFALDIKSDGYSFWADTLSIVVGLDHSEKEIHQSYRLSQNFPNPFNPLTRIEFELPKSKLVTLKVFNLLGKEVSTLVSKKLGPGNYSYKYDGNHLTSGIYYYQLKAGEYREVRKMVLVK